MIKNSLIITTCGLVENFISFLGKEVPVLCFSEWLPLLEKCQTGHISKSRLQTLAQSFSQAPHLLQYMPQTKYVYFITEPGLQLSAAIALFADIYQLEKYSHDCINPVNKKTLQEILKKSQNAGKVAAQQFSVLNKVDDLFQTAQNQILPSKDKISIIGAHALDFLYQKLMQQPVKYIQNNIVYAQLADKDQTYNAELVSINDEPAILPDINYVKAVIIDLKEREYVVLNRQKKAQKLLPPQPLQTSSLIALAEDNFGYTAQDCLEIAMSLYYGLQTIHKYPEGLITFPYTDSTRLPADEILAAREFILNHFGVTYVPQQSASEIQNTLVGAIRPTKVNKTPRQLRKYLSDDQFNIYSLVWNYFLASQMLPAKIENQQIDIAAGDDARYVFQVQQQRITSRGFMQLSEQFGASSDAWAKWRKGNKLQLQDLSFTSSVPSAATFSHFSNVVDALVQEKFPPEVAVNAVHELLQKKLAVLNEHPQIELLPRGAKYRNMLKAGMETVFQTGFTVRLAQNLDKIQLGKTTVAKVLPDYEKLFLNMQSSAHPHPINTKCPHCGGNLLTEKTNVYHCENYPFSCHYVYKKSDESASIRRCIKCGSEMIEKNGPFGRFLACSAFPKCRHSEPFSLDVHCPQSGCNGRIVERKTKNGATFYGCSEYPACKFASWQQPVNAACPECGNIYLLLKPGDMDSYKCPACKKAFHIDLSPKIG